MFHFSACGQKFGVDATGLPADSDESYFSELVRYEIDGEDQMDYMGYVHISWMSKNRFSCTLYPREEEVREETDIWEPPANYTAWRFGVGLPLKRNGETSRKLSHISLDGSDGWGYLDPKAHGKYTFSEKERLLTLDITFHIHYTKSREILSWKVPDKNLSGRKFRSSIETITKENSQEGKETESSYCEMAFENDSVCITSYSLQPDGSKELKSQEAYTYSMNGYTFQIEQYDAYHWVNIYVYATRLKAFKQQDRENNRYSDYEVVWFEEITEGI